MSSLISVNNLSRFYGNIKAVDNISFKLNTGDILGLLGTNGAGKSSTMQMLTGNLAPSEGEISINGIDLLENPKAAKVSLGYLPENPPLYKEMTVMEYLQFCARLHQIPATQIGASCDRAIEQCSLQDVQHRLISHLSKGYQQRTGIAQAILHLPPVIILDEPTVGLDPVQMMEIRELIKTLGENHGIILCTHILSEVQAVCNRVQIINQGKLVYDADMNSINDQQTSQYRFTLRDELDADTLRQHDAFSTVDAIDNNTFITETSLQADQLAEYIVQQQWGLTELTPYQSSLEQIFIKLSLNHQDLDNHDLKCLGMSNQEKQ